jgi:hypothetical protein
MAMLQLPKTPDHLSPAQGLAASQTMNLGHELVDAGGEQKVPRQTPKHDMNFTLFSYYILLYFTIFSSLRLMHVSFFLPGGCSGIKRGKSQSFPQSSPSC